MKKIKIVFTLILVVSMLLSLCACGGSDTAADDPVLGTYTGVACEAFGYIGDISEIYEGDCRIELKKGNKCAIKLDGDSFDGKYTLEGEALNITIQGTNSPGTL